MRPPSSPPIPPERPWPRPRPCWAASPSPVVRPTRPLWPPWSRPPRTTTPPMPL